MPADVPFNQARVGEVSQTEFTLIPHTADVNDRQVTRAEALTGIVSLTLR